MLSKKCMCWCFIHYTIVEFVRRINIFRIANLKFEAWYQCQNLIGDTEWKMQFQLQWFQSVEWVGICQLITKRYGFGWRIRWLHSWPYGIKRIPVRQRRKSRGISASIGDNRADIWRGFGQSSSIRLESIGHRYPLGVSP